MEIVLARRVTPRLRDRLWQLYREAFASVQHEAIGVQKLDRSHFETLVDDETTFKVLGMQAGEPQGLLLLTDRIDLVPGINAEPLAARYPAAWERRAVYYVPFAYVARSCRVLTLYGSLIAAASQIVAVRDGVAVIDMCRHLRDLGQVNLIERAIRGFDDSAVEEVDAQFYYAVKLPKPTQRLVGQVAMPDVVVDLGEHALSVATAQGSRDPAMPA